MAEAGPESRDSLQQQQPRLERKRVPLSEQPVGEMKIDRSIQLYREDIVRNGKARLEAVRETTEAKDLIHRLYSAPDFTQVESPWTCSRSRPPDRDPTPNKVLANKDTTVGTKLDLEGMRHYRTKLSDIWTAAYNNELEEVNLYLSCGADPNTRNSMLGNGETALHNAALGGHLEMIELLVQEGKADTDLQDNCGNTPLHIAARSGHYDAALRLMDFDAKAQIKNDSQQTPWMVAHLQGHVKLRDQLPKPHNYSIRTAGKTVDGGSKVKMANSQKPPRRASALFLSQR
eukprot:INCI16559.1.p1 GENE.INCI16559.1~~INCI16559.1.p1  ORF type:complete len:288 (-),score=62.59 INCI16559.1:115-978(-)